MSWKAPSGAVAVFGALAAIPGRGHALVYAPALLVDHPEPGPFAEHVATV
jgi:hypothetical protein